MSKNLAEQFFDRIKQMGPEVKAEANRMAGHGASELAAALFKGDPFVMYGPGQRAAKVEQEQFVHAHEEPTAEHGNERGEQELDHQHTRGR